MCLIALAWRAHPAYPLVVAANRDEWRERPTQAAHWWPEHPGLLAGRDLQAGGTWMGYTRAGRFAAITNFRDPADRRSTALSRGTLVTEFLLGHESPEAFVGHLATRAGHYNGFNLIVGDGQGLYYYGSREGDVRAIEPGVHALSNHLLDEPWPKVKRARVAMRQAIADRDPALRLFEVLSDTDGAPDEELPDTGVGLELERRLAAPLITGVTYGTRASTVLKLGADGNAQFEERSRDQDGGVVGVASYRFDIETSRASSSPLL
jgi:uncharacterized protein with NRDE domain